MGRRRREEQDEGDGEHRADDRIDACQITNRAETKKLKKNAPDKPTTAVMTVGLEVDTRAYFPAVRIVVRETAKEIYTGREKARLERELRR